MKDKINQNVREHRSITGPGIDEIELLELHDFDMFEAIEKSEKLTDIEDDYDADTDVGRDIVDGFSDAFDEKRLLGGAGDVVTQPLGDIAVTDADLPDLEEEL